MIPKNRSRSARRLRIVALSTSLGLLGGVATAQDTDLGDAIRGGIDAQIEAGQRGNLNPTERGIGEAVRGVLQGENAGDALRRGVGEAARSATETPQQTLRRDQYDAYRDGVQGRQLYDAQGRPLYDAQGRPLYDTRMRQPGTQQFGTQQFGAQQFGTRQYGSDIQSRARARLGISMDQSADGVAIQEVMQGTAAANAGLRSGDVIVSVDGRPVSNPNEISTWIRQRSPGDQVDLVVIRDGQRETINATLTGYEAGDRQRMARPALEGEAGDLRQQVQQLQEEVRRLRNELEQMKSTQGAGAQAGADAAVEADATRTETELDVDAEAVPPRPAAPGDAEADADAGLDADAAFDLDAAADDANAGAAADAGAELDAEAAGAEAEADAGAAGAASQR